MMIQQLKSENKKKRKSRNSLERAILMLKLLKLYIFIHIKNERTSNKNWNVFFFRLLLLLFGFLFVIFNWGIDLKKGEQRAEGTKAEACLQSNYRKSRIKITMTWEVAEWSPQSWIKRFHDSQKQNENERKKKVPLLWRLIVQRKML